MCGGLFCCACLLFVIGSAGLLFTVTPTPLAVTLPWLKPVSRRFGVASWYGLIAARSIHYYWLLVCACALLCHTLVFGAGLFACQVWTWKTHEQILAASHKGEPAVCYWVVVVAIPIADKHQQAVIAKCVDVDMCICCFAPVCATQSTYVVHHDLFRM